MVREQAIYVEGGGDSKNEKMAFRKGMDMLLENAGFKGKLPRIWPCGGRDQTFQEFQAAISRRNNTETSILLVDSEDTVKAGDLRLDSPLCWAHLKARDGWEKPPHAANIPIAIFEDSSKFCSIICGSPRKFR